MEQPLPLLQRREGAVLVLSNNNPAARNALSPAFYAALTEALAQAEADPTVGAIVLTGERISGERLHALGPVNRLSEPGEALAQAVALAAQVATGPDAAMGRIKALCRSAYAQPLDAQLELEAQLMVQSQATEESREGIGAFLEKRPADFARLRQVNNAVGAGTQDTTQ